MSGKAVFVFSLCLFFLLAGSDLPSLTLYVQGQENKVIYVSTPVVEGDRLTLSWIHSVEKTPWEETYIVLKDGVMLLEETVFHSFGAGVPHEKGTMTVEDGQIVARGMNDQVDALKWIHSHSVHFQLNINGERVFTGADLPHHEKIEIVIHEEVNEHDRKTNN